MAQPNTLDPEAAAAARAMFDYDITLIQQSSIGNTTQGKEIVELLRTFNEAGRIKYTEMEERGAWDGTDILVNANYLGKVFITTCELVHEASHALWRKKNPTKVMTQIEIDNEEKDARVVQAKVYVWLRASKGAPVDSDLENRLTGLGVAYPKGAKR